jgi:hypothetical protein
VTDSGGGDDRGPLFARVLPPAFERHVWILPVGATRPIGESTHRDALVEVEQGEIELRFGDGHRLRFGHCDVLWLHGLPRGVLRSRGPQLAVLVAVRRRAR